MKCCWSKSLLTLLASGLFAVTAWPDLAEFNAINAAARAARERGDNAALLANMMKMAAMVPGHPAAEIGLARGLGNQDAFVIGTAGEGTEPVLIGGPL
jgi:hypothetical protein